MATQSEILRLLLQGENKSLIDALSGADAALDGTESAAQRLAIQMSAMAKVIETEGKQAAAATEALSSAMGADLVAAIERAGGSVDQIVADLHRAGAAYDDLRANAEQVAGSLRELDAAGRSATGGSLTPNVNHAADSMRRLGHESDQSRSVLANLVGNTAQDLGQLGGVAGSAGVALGQLAEYAADGNISLASMARFAGPLAALGLASWGISAAFDAAAKRAEEAARKTEVLRDILAKLNEGDTTGAAEDIVTEYEKTIPILERFGYTSANVKDTLEGSGTTIRSLERDYRAFEDRLASLNDKSLKGPLTGDEEAEIVWLMQQMNDLDAVLNTLRADQEKAGVEAKWMEDHARRVAEVNQAIQSGSGYWAQYAAAARQSASVANDLADQDKAATSAANKLRALRDEVEAYIESANNIPEEEITEIRAALDAGNVALVERLLDQITRPRLINIGIALAPATSTRSRGGGQATAPTGKKAGDPTKVYDPAGLISDMLDDELTSGGGGGGGGGGSTETPEEKAERQAQAFDKAYDNLYRTGQARREDYRAHLQRRLADYATYTDEYRTLWDKIHALDQEELAAKKELEDAEKRRQEEAKKAAEDAQKAAEKQVELLRQLLGTMTDFLTAVYGNLEGTAVGGNQSGAGAAIDLASIGGMLAAAIAAYNRSVS